MGRISVVYLSVLVHRCRNIGDGKEDLHCINCKILQCLHFRFQDRFFTIFLIFKSFLTSLKDRCLATCNSLLKLLLLIVKFLARKPGLGKNDRQVIILAKENEA